MEISTTTAVTNLEHDRRLGKILTSRPGRLIFWLMRSASIKRMPSSFFRSILFPVFENQDAPEALELGRVIRDQEVAGNRVRCGLRYPTLGPAYMKLSCSKRNGLSDVRLPRADLRRLILKGANLSGATATKAVLIDADMSGATCGEGVTEKHLEEQAKVPKGATMPDGSIHDRRRYSLGIH